VDSRKRLAHGKPLERLAAAQQFAVDLADRPQDLAGLVVIGQELRRLRGRVFTSFLPGVSADAKKRMQKTVRGWRIPRQTPANLAELAEQYNSVIRGWWSYYGTFYPTAMRELARHIDRKLEHWARRKYHTLSRHKRRSVDWLSAMKEWRPTLFHHWSFYETKAG
jgi:RNA-directed DNA polymerase